MSEQSHIVPYRTLIYVWIGLLLFTGLTVLVAQFNLGMFNVWVALLIAAGKSALVIAFFMHLKYETRLFRLALFSALAILAIFIGFTFFDVLYR